MEGRLTASFRRAPTRYVPLRRIALGGMAEVWEADALFETGEGIRVAIKRVLPELASNELFASMFEDEARLGMLLRHPNIVRVFDARDVHGTKIMIMELVEGCSLKAIVDSSQNQYMPLPLALHITREILRGLEYAHTATGADGRHLAIVHRDVSPHNVLLGRNGTVKLADFGLADAQVHETSLGNGMLGGKLAYLPPEVIEQQPMTIKADLFATGIVLWELLAGARLFQREDDGSTVRAVRECEVPSLSSIRSDITPNTVRALQGLLARDPSARYASARDALRDVNNAIRETDSTVSSRHVALLVAAKVPKEEVPPMELLGMELLMEELAQFVSESGFGNASQGAEPLDPDLF